MPEHLRVSVELPVSPQRLYQAWLDSTEHGAFSGGAAQIEAFEGGTFTAWDGYIHGKTLTLEPYKRIVQSWRTSEFPEEAPDSRLEVLIEPQDDNSVLTLIHENIPDGQSGEYEKGWLEYYFKPMREYFAPGK